MTCEACGFESEAGQKFCNQCGLALARSCPDGHPNPPASKFCGECGTPLSSTPASEPTAPVAERRFISALFADLVGFTAMTEASDAEDVREMLTVYFERAKGVIERFGGDVDKFIGDAITAFWGTTTANEDDAERAVRAGLELVDLVDSLGGELGLDLALRVGVLSGETAVGEGGNQHGLVIGDIVNTAARIQSAAEPGTVYVGESTHDLTADAFVYRDVGSVDAKGKTEPVGVWRAESVVGQRGGGGRWTTVEPPFVGREDELRFLKDQVHATSRDRSARLVSIVGEPGIGKSRIAWELVKYLDGVTEVFKWHQGRSPAYGEGVTLWSLAEMVRSRAGIADDDPATSARTRLRTCVAEYLPDPDEQAWAEPKLAALLGLEDASGMSRGELFSAIRTFFQRIAAQDTVVMLFEDLHWADGGQLEFIEELVEMSSSSPILVVTLARSDLLDRRPDWGTARSGFSSLHLGPLSDDEMTDLVLGLVPDAVQSLVEGVVGRAGGVPLYAVEFIRALVDAGSLVSDGPALSVVGSVEEVGLPDSLQAVVGSRLDRLAAEDRSLVQDCAILGHSFTIDGLAALTGIDAADLQPRLRELTRRELLRLEVDPLSPERGQYQFVQGVIREVAYGRIGKAVRVARHAKVAEYFETVLPVEGAAVIADHYLKAYALDPDETLADRARLALVGAARRAEELGSYAQALVLAEQGLGVPASDSDRLELRELASKAASATLNHARAVDVAREALAWASAHGTDQERWRATTCLGLALIEGDLPHDAMEVLRPAFEPSLVADPRMAELGSILANAAMRDANFQLAADVAVPVIVAAEVSGDMTTLLEAMTTRGTALPQLGRFHEGVALLREAMRLAGDSWSGLRALNNLLLYASVDGYMAVEDLGRRGVEMAELVGHAALRVRLASWDAPSRELKGDFQGALDAIAGVHAQDGGYWEASLEAWRQRLLWHVSGDTVHVRRSIELVTGLLDNPEPQYRDWAKAWLAEEHWHLDDVDRAWNLATGLADSYESGLPPAVFPHRHAALAVAISRRDLDAVAMARMMHFDAGRRRDAFVGLCDITDAVLRDSPVDPAAARSVIEAVEDADGPLPAAEWKAQLASVIDEPWAAGLAAEAHAWFTSVGDLGNLSRFADVFADFVPGAAVG